MYYFYVRGCWKKFIVITFEIYQDLIIYGFTICTLNKYFGGRCVIDYNDKLLLEL